MTQPRPCIDCGTATTNTETVHDTEVTATPSGDRLERQGAGYDAPICTDCTTKYSD